MTCVKIRDANKCHLFKHFDTSSMASNENYSIYSLVSSLSNLWLYIFRSVIKNTRFHETANRLFKNNLVIYCRVHKIPGIEKKPPQGTIFFVFSGLEKTMRYKFFDIPLELTSRTFLSRVICQLKLKWPSVDRPRFSSRFSLILSLSSFLTCWSQCDAIDDVTTKTTLCTISC